MQTQAIKDEVNVCMRFNDCNSYYTIRFAQKIAEYHNYYPRTNVK